MCGIAGSTAADIAILSAMRERIRHRGPDGDGIWQEGGVGLAHTRLAIIDLSPDGAQPMHSADGRHVITFNGEIYNHRALRSELEQAGEVFRTSSDTEVLLRLLTRHGVAGLDRVVGMFAFALWDRERRELLLGRDRLGIKPLLYATLPDGGLAFASEIEALKAHPDVDLARDDVALSLYLACLYVPAPRTIHRGIRRLAPGHVVRWRAGVMGAPSAYWQPRYLGTRTLTVEAAAEELTPLLRQAVRDCLVADVPVGCFLSGGIDSSVIAALMAEALRERGERLQTFTMTFEEAAYDERAAAAVVAKRIDSRHTELPASPDLTRRTTAMIRHFGEPFGNPTALLIDDLSRKAREHVTVALVGDGGDEVFAGYPRYEGGLLARRYRKVPAFLREQVIAPLAALIPESSSGRHALRRAREFLSAANLSDDEMYAAWIEYFDPGERAGLLGLAQTPSRPIAALYREQPSTDPLDAMQGTDLVSFLPGNLLAYGDTMSMAHALELRLPLLDHRLVDAVGRIAPAVRVERGKKTLLRAMATRLLPAEILDRPKRGFNPPMGVWLRQHLAAEVDRRLTEANAARLGLRWTEVSRLLDEHRRGGRDHALKIWALVMLDVWTDAQEGTHGADSPLH